MKSWMLFPFILIFGWMMGGWLPKAELRTVREDLKVAQRALSARAPRRAGFTGVTQMLGIPKSSPTPDRVDVPEQDEPETPVPDASVAGSDQPAPEIAASKTNNASRGRSMKHGIQEAMEVWEARCDIARSTFVANVALAPEQATRFDVLVAAMNIRLAHSIEQFAQQVKSGEAVSEEQTVKLMRDLTTSVASTYDELDGSMPPNWRADAGKKFSVTDFIDPSVALPLVDVEDELGEGMIKH
ncbi:MAG: hypothetical protein HN919_16915 [Verrucomicrobia bacterium]|jgi:hypothetical protein|nr:hypothetical protein [Verrucomicrobiota bacterium]MBT7067982.1 hypothetical protein [Verrucomicrobiota bacterium]MBT7699262.1 hypothetical protein [Verrucomicrobiota bacterium]